MAPTRTNKLNKERGERHKLFRTDVLEKSQTELAGELDKSQTTISNFDLGQDIPAELKNYYTKRGLNWNWYYTGQGPMLRVSNSATMEEAAVSYETMSRHIAPDNVEINEALEEFMEIMRKQLQNYDYIKSVSHFTENERADLLGRLFKRIQKEAEILKKNY